MMSHESQFHVVLTDYEWPDLSIEHGIFSPLGINFTAAQCRHEDEVLRLSEHADAIILGYAPLSRKVIRSLQRCKIISMSGAGFDNVDLETATEEGILIVNCPDYCFEEVADHAMAMILSCARGLFQYDRMIRNGIWDYKSAGPRERIRGSVLGLIGFGRVSQAVTARAMSFGMRVVAYDPFIPDEVFEAQGVQSASREETFAAADYLSIHVPLAKGTRKSIGAEELSRIKRSAFIINTCRGGVVDEKALYEALKSGLIRGAALDVLEKEPPDFDSPLLSLDNVLVTPHAAFYSEDALSEARTRSAQAVIKVFKGELPAHIVNGEVLETGRLRMTATSTQRV
ncbi:MAG: C-terminal binding protein [Deltaproteobacteria bacterium]|nr:C-terminal binding protein [Deltaproteobacteria bacterium]